MDKEEAAKVAFAELEALIRLGYERLASRLEETETREVTTSSGKTYQIETMVYWEGRAANGALRVIAAVDDGGMSAFRPLSRAFIMNADGSLVE